MTTIGTPITTLQAARGVLRMIRSPIVGNVDADTNPGYTLQRLTKVDREVGCAPYDQLSSGERHLVDIARSIWTGHGADLSAIGGLDRTNRRRIVVILAYLHLGRDLALDLQDGDFAAVFGESEVAS